MIFDFMMTLTNFFPGLFFFVPSDPFLSKAINWTTKASGFCVISISFLPWKHNFYFRRPTKLTEAHIS